MWILVGNTQYGRYIHQATNPKLKTLLLLGTVKCDMAGVIILNVTARQLIFERDDKLTTHQILDAQSLKYQQ